MKIKNGYYMSEDGFLIYIEKATNGLYRYENIIGIFTVWQERLEEILEDMIYCDFYNK